MRILYDIFLTNTRYNMAEFRTIYGLKFDIISAENYECLQTFSQIRQFGYLKRSTLIAHCVEYVCTRELGRSCLHSETLRIGKKKDRTVIKTFHSKSKNDEKSMCKYCIYIVFYIGVTSLLMTDVNIYNSKILQPHNTAIKIIKCNKINCKSL
jgi:hypothetical protein